MTFAPGTEGTVYTKFGITENEIAIIEKFV